MSLGDGLNYFKADEFIVGADHPTLDDTINRALKSLIAKFDAGADTQVTRSVIKIESGTDIEDGVETDDVVYYDHDAEKYKKCGIDNVPLGFINVDNLAIYTIGMYKFADKDDLEIGSIYYSGDDGTITTDDKSKHKVGIAFDTNLIYNVTIGSSITSGDMYSTEGMVIHTNTITEDYTLPEGYNAVSAGDVEIEDGVTVEIQDGSSWVIV